MSSLSPRRVLTARYRHPGVPFLFQVAFALSFYALLEGNPGFETVWESMVSLFVMSMGEITIPFSHDR